MFHATVTQLIPHPDTVQPEQFPAGGQIPLLWTLLQRDDCSRCDPSCRSTYQGGEPKLVGRGNLVRECNASGACSPARTEGRGFDQRAPVGWERLGRSGRRDAGRLRAPRSLPPGRRPRSTASFQVLLPPSRPPRCVWLPGWRSDD